MKVLLQYIKCFLSKSEHLRLSFLLIIASKSSVWISIYVIYGPIAIILDNSITSSNPKETFPMLCMKWLHLFWLNRQLGGYLIFLIIVCELVEDCVVFDFSILKKKIQGGLTNRDHLLDYIPEDAL